MKKLSLTLFGLILSGAFFSIGCKKCKTCTQTTFTTVNTNTPGYPQQSIFTFELCGNKELKAVDGKVTTSTSSSGVITAKSTVSTNCK